MSQIRKLIQIKNELGPWNICFPQPSEFPGPVPLAAAQQLCQHRAGGWHRVRAEQPFWRREGGTLSLLTISPKSDTELRQPDLESRAFSFSVCNHYIKWAEYFVTKYQQKHGSKGMLLDAVCVILLVFQWCDVVVSSLGINETEPSIETITMVFPAFTHCHKQSCSKAPYPMDVVQLCDHGSPESCTPSCGTQPLTAQPRHLGIACAATAAKGPRNNTSGLPNHLWFLFS